MSLAVCRKDGGGGHRPNATAVARRARPRDRPAIARPRTDPPTPRPCGSAAATRGPPPPAAPSPPPRPTRPWSRGSPPPEKPPEKCRTSHRASPPPPPPGASPGRPGTTARAPWRWPRSPSGRTRGYARLERPRGARVAAAAAPAARAQVGARRRERAPRLRRPCLRGEDLTLRLDARAHVGGRPRGRRGCPHRVRARARVPVNPFGGGDTTRAPRALVRAQRLELQTERKELFERFFRFFGVGLRARALRRNQIRRRRFLPVLPVRVRAFRRRRRTRRNVAFGAVLEVHVRAETRGSRVDRVFARDGARDARRVEKKRLTTRRRVAGNLVERRR